MFSRLRLHEGPIVASVGRGNCLTRWIAAQAAVLPHTASTEFPRCVSTGLRTEEPKWGIRPNLVLGLQYRASPYLQRLHAGWHGDGTPKADRLRGLSDEVFAVIITLLVRR